MVLRGLAKAVSLVFHPLLVLTYMTVLLLIVNPYGFGAVRLSEKIPLLLAIFFSSFVIPGIAVVLMRFLGLVESMELRDKRERIGPYIVTAIFYLWIYIGFRNDPSIPTVFTTFALGAIIGVFVSFFINIFSKISAHTVGMGGLIGMLVMLMSLNSFDPVVIRVGATGLIQTSMATLFLVVLLIAGLVGTSRLLLKAHENMDVYGGYLVGMASQFVAFQILMV